ncbi:MAG TPA: hypothetical protein VM659_05400 [Dongiaceae bacterium]|nr:hypothetical protein [Dongiaceae bacterium]
MAIIISPRAAAPAIGGTAQDADTIVPSIDLWNSDLEACVSLRRSARHSAEKEIVAIGTGCCEADPSKLFGHAAKLSTKPSSGCGESGHSVQSGCINFTQHIDLKQQEESGIRFA